MSHVTINLIPGLPEIAFRHGYGQYEGVVMHATANTANACQERLYETAHYPSAFVHTFSDKEGTLQVASYQFIAYGAGHTANQRYLHNELCEARNDGEGEHAIAFKAAYENWILSAAEQLHARGLGVVDGVTLLSHDQVSKTWHESDHSDPIAFLAEWDKVWSDVVNDVTYLYNQMDAKENEPMTQPVVAPVTPDWMKEGLVWLQDPANLSEPVSSTWDAGETLTIGALGVILKRFAEKHQG